MGECMMVRPPVSTHPTCNGPIQLFSTFTIKCNVLCPTRTLPDPRPHPNPILFRHHRLCGIWHHAGGGGVIAWLYMPTLCSSSFWCYRVQSPPLCSIKHSTTVSHKLPQLQTCHRFQKPHCVQAIVFQAFQPGHISHVV